MPLDDIRVVLVEPAHPGNIGAVARAMKTMSLTRLMLVRPLDFPAEEATRRAKGSVDILERAQVFDRLDDALGDCKIVIGGSARSRSVPHPTLDARQCGALLIEETRAGDPAALVFGPERSGLANEDLDRCNYQVLIPTSETLSSLNLASAVQLICYEVLLASREAPAQQVPRPGPPASSHEEMEYFYAHLERALDSRGFLDGEMGDLMMVKLRRLFGRSRPNVSEVKILRSITRLIHRDGD